MKKVLLSIAIILSITTHSQVSISLPVGISSLKVPTMGLNLQGQIKNLILATGFDHHVSAKKVNGTFFWARFGMAIKLTELNGLEVSTGYGSHDHGTESKELNQGLVLLNAQFIHQMKYHPEAAIFGSITATKKFVIISGGLRLIFGRDGRRKGCPGSW